MPILPTPDYKPNLFFLGSHVETLYPYLFRKIDDVGYERQRLELPDGDFIDLDWVKKGADHLLILCHGLEGSSQSQYMKGMTLIANRQDLDVLCINFRSCSGEMNRKLRMYHHGEISDLQFVVNQIVDRDQYRYLSLCGFSLGGNVILKYLGTLGEEAPELIKSAVAVSVPCDLASSSEALDQWYNYLYTRRFMHSLKPKFEYKSQQFPGAINMEMYDQIKTWRQFDDTYTTKVTGFNSASEYYEQGSAK
ncbi:MAG: alpha/beta fold hydrolase, partial [Saprospiraceae bacterium]|nr:alpha/beta fold hydrolase [Saprospiraceae bacterium]